jgi:hypothetical protein
MPVTGTEDVQEAQHLLEGVRRTPMRRGAISSTQGRLKQEIAAAIASQGVAAALSERIALQLVFKFDAVELADCTVWSAIGRILREEVGRLRERAGLAERQIAEVLPKLSARDAETFLDELRAADRRIARTIFNAALQSADPLATGRRYLAEYQGVAEQLQAVDPRVARTLANASFTASTPRRKAMEHFNDIAALGAAFARLAAHGVECEVARTLAASSRFRGYLRGTDALAPLDDEEKMVR